MMEGALAVGRKQAEDRRLHSIGSHCPSLPTIYHGEKEIENIQEEAGQTGQGLSFCGEE